MTDISAVQEIDKEIAELQAKRKAILEGQRKDALKQARALVEAYGITASELGFLKATATSPDKKASKKREPKYANPADPGQTWGGGAKPKWVKAHEANGGKLEDLLIRK